LSFNELVYTVQPLSLSLPLWGLCNTFFIGCRKLDGACARQRFSVNEIAWTTGMPAPCLLAGSVYLMMVQHKYVLVDIGACI